MSRITKAINLSFVVTAAVCPLGAKGGASVALDHESLSLECHEGCAPRSADHVMLQHRAIKKSKAAAGASVACTGVDTDPFETGPHVNCCDGLVEEKGTWKGYWHFQCNKPDGSAPAPVPAPAQESLTFKLMEWNVHWENKDVNGVAEIIKANHPDIVGLCELTTGMPEMEGALASVTGRAFKVQPGRGVWQGYGTDIFYDSDKWSAVEGGVQRAPCADSRGGPRAANWVVLEDVSLKNKIIVGGTHVSYCEHGCDALHECELTNLYDKLESMRQKFPQAPVFWMGDLNRNIYQLITQNLFHGKIGNKGTFELDDLAHTTSHTYYMGGFAVDYIFGEKGAVQIEAGGTTGQGVIGQHLKGADHFPIYATVKLPAK